jgi:hypothetical protein
MTKPKTGPGKLPLRSWEQFCQDMNQPMQQFDEELHQHILIALYDYAAFGRWLENVREDIMGSVPAIRTERRRRRRLKLYLDRAIAALRKAKRKEPQFFFETLTPSLRKLEQASKDAKVRDELLIAMIPPALRDATEKRRRISAPSPEVQNIIPGYGIAKIDHDVIKTMQRYMKQLYTNKRKALSSAKIDSIISSAIVAAFGGNYEPDRVKSALRERGKVRNRPGQK